MVMSKSSRFHIPTSPPALLLEVQFSPSEKITLDVRQLLCYYCNMIMDRIRQEIQNCGKTRYQISQETGIDQAALCRIMQGGSCKAQTLETLLEYFGFAIMKKRSSEKR